MNLTPYETKLGIASVTRDNDSASLQLPFLPENANAVGVLHGGVISSLVVSSARAAALDPDEAGQIVDIDVQFLNPVGQQTLTGVGEVLRSGRQLSFVRVTLTRDDGVPAAAGMVTIRRVDPNQADQAVNPATATIRIPDEPAADRSPIAAFLENQSFTGQLGVRVLEMKDSRAVLDFPYQPDAGDNRGNHHEGAIAALLDTTGAMAALAGVEPGNLQASTPGLQMNFLGESAGSRLAAVGTVAWQRDEAFLCPVQVFTADTGKVVATGTVHYRIAVRR